MLELVWLIPLLPFVGFLVLALLGSRLSQRQVALVGVGSVGLAALLAALVAVRFLGSLPSRPAYGQTLWTWMAVAGFTPTVGWYLDALSLVMVLVITVVGFLIHLYAAEFMHPEEGYSRFFAYMNLFVGSMLTLVLADNLLLLYLGWEGVGLCSYLLIGFWYTDPANERAARTWPPSSGVAVAAAALLLGGALGKSAQLPLQTWLPDAMAGPTPVSALIHAATMVTAGVYLIARTHVPFELAPAVQT